MPKQIQYVQGHPLNRAFFALNHYMSTGDHVGEGISYDDPNGGLMLMLLHRPADTTDAEDWERLKARLEEMQRAGFPLRLVDQGDVPSPTNPREFRAWSLHLAEFDLDRFARQLRANPGPLGWGSMKAFLDQYEWRDV